MTVALARPIVIQPHGAASPCAGCDARRASVCQAIPDADLARLASAAVSAVAQPGTTFIDEGYPANGFFNITSGTVRLFKMLPDGRRQILGFAGTGHFLGLGTPENYGLSAEAIDTVRYCWFPKARMRALLDDFPLMERRLLEVASSELIAAQEQMLLLGRKSARERVASFMLAQSRRGSACQHPSPRFTLLMNRADIADYLGLTIETVSRTLTKLQAEGLIEISHTSAVAIRNQTGLENLAEGRA
jgi:CRP/FNR family transcriptional regulator